MMIQFLLFLAEELPSSPAIPTPPLVPPPEMETAMQGYGGAFFKMFIALIGLLVAVFLAAWALRRLSKGGFGHKGQSIQVLEKRPLSQKTMLYLLEVEGEKVVIAESQLEVKRILTLNPLTQVGPEE
jgi:flagellar protein FliO/FliZ